MPNYKCRVMCQNLSLGPNISMDLKMYNYVCVLLLNAFKIGIRAIKEDKRIRLQSSTRIETLLHMICEK